MTQLFQFYVYTQENENIYPPKSVHDIHMEQLIPNSKSWNCANVHELMGTMSIYTTEYFSVVKKNEVHRWILKTLV